MKLREPHSRKVRNEQLEKRGRALEGTKKRYTDM